MTRLPVGIYRITNNKNGKVYIGQSQNMYERGHQHRNALKSGHHPNSEMQADGKKYSRYFRGDVIEYCSLKDLNEREKYGIDKYNSIEEGYNKGGVPFKRKKQENKKTPRRYGQ